MLVPSTALSLALLASVAQAAGHNARPAHARRAAASESTATGTATHTHKINAASATVTSAATTTAAASSAAAESALPLTQYTYAYSDIPYQVDPYKCNSSTAGDDSSCQTLIANNISDFCLWGSDTAATELSTIGDIEAATVSYCTSNNWGARVLKSGALTAVQVLRTEYYIQWTGRIDQTALHLEANDTGGELDPHGADLLGNPLGGLVYSSGLPGGDNSTLEQAVEWNMFIGSGVFCLKLCSPNQPSGINYCENTYDRMGCNYNMPASYTDNEFTDCDSDLQLRVGVYVGDDNKTSTYSQPPEGTEPAPPYTPSIPATSNCKTYESTALWAAATTTSASSGSASSAKKTGTSDASSSNSSSSSSSSSSSDSGSGGSATATLFASTGFLALVAGMFAVLA
ncbi:hypothetical protein JCM8547_008706 [Rhodosporidiobolus lusitaniae]